MNPGYPYRTGSSPVAALTPGPGEVIVGGADGPVAVPGTVVETRVADGIGEWWIHPLATYMDHPYPRTVFGAISQEGDIVACEMNHGTGRTRRYVVGTARVDDHNAPALWIAPGRRAVLAWTQHNYDNVLRFKIGSPSGDPASLSTAPLRTHLAQANVSYTQIFRIEHLSDESQDTFWCFYRTVSSGVTHWCILPFTVNQATGEATWGDVVTLTSIGDAYAIVADAHAEGNQILRIALGRNPAQGSDHPVRYFEIDCVTGDITSPADEAFSAAISGNNLPITNESLSPFLPTLDSGLSRRLFYVRPGPDQFAVAYAEWPDGAPDEAQYKVAEWPGDVPDILTLSAASDYARVAYHESLNDENGFEYTIVFRLPETPAWLVLGDRLSGSSGWRLRFTAAANLEASVWTTSGNIFHNMGWLDAPWGEVVAMRLRVDTGEGTIRRFVSANPLESDPTWVELGSGAGVAITGSVVASDAPLTINGGAGEGFIPEVYRTQLLGSGGGLLAGVDFGQEWEAGEPTFTDSAGRDWSLGGAAEVVEVAGTPVVTDYGIAGPRVGNTPAVNYIAGMGFEDPSYDRAVMVARSVDGVDTLERYVGNVHEILHSQPTSRGRIIRPYGPWGGGPLAAIVSDVQSYGEYTDYESDVRGISK